jgi:hypothetical protein
LGAISGNLSKGKSAIEINPTRTIRIEQTVVKTGRLMNGVERDSNMKNLGFFTLEKF